MLLNRVLLWRMLLQRLPVLLWIPLWLLLGQLWPLLLLWTLLPLLWIPSLFGQH